MPECNDCKEIFELLMDFLDEDFEEEILDEELSLHIEECEHCRCLFNTYRKTIQLYEELEMLQVPDEIHKQLTETIRIEINRSTYRRRK